MTDHPRNATHQPVPGLQQVSANDVVATSSRLGSTPLPTNGTAVDEEGSFTIKCICKYVEDDGYTILCENCNTWQHTDCYYEPENVPGDDDIHSCVDCDPRILDARRANEIQQAKMADINIDDRKMKKPVKSQKKKIKPIDSLPNWSDKHELGSPRNGMPKESKKVKSAHKHSASMHAGHANAPKLVSRRSLSHTVQSPSKGSDGGDLTGEPYTEDFMHLYDEDPEDPKANLFGNIAVSSLLARWSNDVDDLASVTNGKKHPEVFLRTEPLDNLPRPQLQKHVKEDTTREFHGRHPKWTYLTTNSSLLRDSFVGELVGKIGLMADYVHDEASRWEYLRHPLPFIFFHPHLPIFIDTRNEGSLLRYVRRSCNPNLALKTFLENGSDYRFGFVATKNIEAGMELTIPWTTDEHVRLYTQQNYAGIKTEGQSDTESYVVSFFNKVFAHFGGCACETPDDCAINKLARRIRAVDGNYPTTNGKKKGRKAKEQGPSRPNNSRSGSEAVRYKEDDDDDDAQSTSTSSRSKPQSRDMTPQDPKTSGLDEMSEREKRKLAAAVERFDQDKNQPQAKKKKRTSGPSNNIHATMPTPPSVITSSDRMHKGSASSRPSPMDTGLIRKHSGSPTYKTTFPMPDLPRKPLTTAGSPTLIPPIQPPPNYVSTAMQTDPDPDDWMTKSSPEQPRRKIISLKKQLLMKTHHEKGIAGEKLKSESPTTNGLSPVKFENASMASRGDVNGEAMAASNMSSASVSPLSGIPPAIEKQQSPSLSTEETRNHPPEPIPQPSPTTLPNGPASAPKVNGFREPDLQIPSPPALMTNGLPPNPTNSTQSPLAQSPSVIITPSLGSLASPSPIKKKLSLGDYISRKGSNLSKPDTLAPTASKEKDIDSPTSVLAAPASDETGDRMPAMSTTSDNGPEQMAVDAVTVQGADNMEVDT